MNYVWRDIKFLNDDNKKMINKYFENKQGKFVIDKNILIVNFDSWGIEKFYLNNNEISKFYYIIHENFKKIFNIAVSVQIGNWTTFKKMEAYLQNFNKINVNFYFILINDFVTLENIEYLKYKYNESVILSGENKGMDIGLFFLNLLYMRYKEYHHDYLYKIHTKTNDEFRNNTLNHLIGSHDKIVNNIRLLNKNKVGMISGNIIYKYNQYKDAFASNLYHLDFLVNNLYNEKINYNFLEFSAGTMFIVKLKIFDILNIKNLEYIYNILNNENTLDYYWYSIFYKMNISNKELIYKDYINNKFHKYPNNISYHIRTGKPGLRDSMIEHAIERLFGYICKKNQYELI